VKNGSAPIASGNPRSLISIVRTLQLRRCVRQRIAEYLYGEKEWIMELIAEALNVSTATISNDLRRENDR
jgi:IS30 family transposase